MIELDFLTGSITGPIADEANLGRGVDDLKPRVLRAVAHQPALLLSFLSGRTHHGQPILLQPGAVLTPDSLAGALDVITGAASVGEAYSRLEPSGILRGWGDDPAKIRDRLALLHRVLSDADTGALAELLDVLPLVTSVVLLSIHGYFAQANVLGKPDTGGQVVYVLQQARALGHYLMERLRDGGLGDVRPAVIILTRLIPDHADTTTHLPLEPVDHSEHAVILRVPFRENNGDVVSPWISRFQVWPYLPRYIEEAVGAITQHLDAAGLGQTPDLILGHYADGNLGAILLRQQFDCVQGFVPHAFEKTKYENMITPEEAASVYNFHIQWLVEAAYLSISDFGQFNSMLEIAGNDMQPSQIAPYRDFGFPGQYHVSDNIQSDDSKLNVNPPGTNTDVFFPYQESSDRLVDYTDAMRQALFGHNTEFSLMLDGETIPITALGVLANPDKPLLFSAARPDRVKNLEKLVEAYADHPELQAQANLVIVTGDLSQEAKDEEERAVMDTIVRTITGHKLQDRVRLLPSKVTGGKLVVMGELYRVIAESGGVFMQPARYEGFGLTVIEAMISGLPVAATQNGGPAEIIQDGINGLLFDPLDAADMAHKALRLVTDRTLWERLSTAGIERVRSTYVWPRHVRRLIADFYAIYHLQQALEPEKVTARRDILDTFITLYQEIATTP
ncbi:MAG: glycosyltransferase [Anaerolineae bacterium]|nr:glycosyltransferase [Anaerolineae bacterium]